MVYYISTCYYYDWIDTSAGGLIIPDRIIRSVVSISSLTWFIIYLLVITMFLHPSLLNYLTYKSLDFEPDEGFYRNVVVRTKIEPYFDNNYIILELLMSIINM
jgi:hypothetical protein